MDPLILDREACRRVDRRAIDELGMSGLVLMENAGRGTVDVLERLGVGGRVVVCCGAGNNGGDGFVIARHLDIRGRAVRVLLLVPPDKLQGDAAANYAIARKCAIPLETVEGNDAPARVAAALQGADWAVDALLGTGARGEPRPPLDRVIDAINAAPLRRLAVDLPSGLDCDTGQAAAHTIRADHTCTFVATKPGFLLPAAHPYTGQVHVVDIGVPRRVVEEAS